jgi:membrane protease YdiL (CAAX protease family)
VKRAAIAASVVAATVVAWLATDAVALPARFWAVLLLVPLPALLAFQFRAAPDIRALPRAAIYLQSLVSSWILGGLTALIVRASGSDLPYLGVFPVPWPSLVAWSAATTAAGILLILIAHAAGIVESPLMHHLLPQTVAEKWLFAALSITAGVNEEFIFRGFLLTVLEDATGSTGIAVIVTTASFGMLHAYQHAGGALRAALLGVVLTVPVLVTGSIIPSVIAHAALDLIAGLALGERLLRSGS